MKPKTEDIIRGLKLLFSKNDSTLPEELDGMQVFPGLGDTTMEALQATPPYLIELYGGTKKCKAASGYFARKAKTLIKENFEDSAKKAEVVLIMLDLLFGSYSRPLIESGEMSLEAACIYAPNYLYLDLYCKRHFKTGLSDLNNACDKNLFEHLKNRDFESLAGRAVYQVGVCEGLLPGYLIADKALAVLDGEDYSEADKLDAERAIYCLSITLNFSSLRALIYKGKTQGDYVENWGYIEPQDHLDRLFAFLGCAQRPRDPHSHYRFWSFCLSPDIAAHLLPAANKGMMVSLLDKLLQRKFVCSHALRDKDAKNPTVARLSKIGEAVRKHTAMGLNCSPSFTCADFTIDTIGSNESAQLEDQIENLKLDLAAAIAKANSVEDLDASIEMRNHLQVLLEQKHSGVEAILKALDVLYNDLIASQAAQIPTTDNLDQEEPGSSEMVDYLESEVCKYEKEVDDLKSEINSLQNTIASLEHKQSAPVATDNGENDYTHLMRGYAKRFTLGEMLEMAQRHYAGKLIFHPSAIKNATFSDPTRFKHIAERIERLAGEFYDKISAGIPLPEAKVSLGNDFCIESKFKRDSPRIMAKRTFVYEGDEVVCEQYLRIGRNLCVYFCPVETKSGMQVLIGYCGDQIDKT